MQREAAEATLLRQPDAPVGESERSYSAGRGVIPTRPGVQREAAEVTLLRQPDPMPIGSMPFRRIQTSATSLLDTSPSASPTSDRIHRRGRGTKKIPVGLNPRLWDQPSGRGPSPGGTSHSGRGSRVSSRGRDHEIARLPTPGPTPVDSIHASIIDAPPGLGDYVPCPAHPESNTTGARESKEERSLPEASRMSLMYASSRIHEALTSRTNQENEFSLNRFLGWPPVRHTRVPTLHHCASVRHTRDIQEDSSHEHLNHNHSEPDASNSNADDHHDEQNECTALLSIRSNLRISPRGPWMHSVYPGFPGS